jgi:urate oxidase
MASYLAESTYGKDKVRVFRVVREDKVHHIVEYNVQVLLEGELDTRQAEITLLFRSILRESE